MLALLLATAEGVLDFDARPNDAPAAGAGPAGGAAAAGAFAVDRI